MSEEEKEKEVDFLGILKDESLPLPFRHFMESEVFKQAVQPDGSIKFPSHIVAIKNAYYALQAMRKKDH